MKYPPLPLLRRNSRARRMLRRNKQEMAMPKKYEKIRDKLKKTLPLAKAKTRAAQIFNSQRKPGQKPVTRNSP